MFSFNSAVDRQWIARIAAAPFATDRPRTTSRFALRRKHFVLYWMLKQVTLAWALALGAALPVDSLRAATDDSQTPKELQAERQRGSQGLSGLGANLFGDQVDLYTGALSFVQNDVDIPGNNALSVGVSRRYVAGRRERSSHFGDWDLDIPRLYGTFTTDLGWLGRSGGVARCSNFGMPTTVVSNTRTRVVSTFWHGNHLYMAGGRSEEVLWRGPSNTAAPTDGNSYPFVTRGNWQLRCLGSIANGSGEGFVAVSPSGVTYQFDWLARRDLRPMRYSTLDAQALSEYWLMPTLIRDRFGNTVSYTYDRTVPWQLKSISASDGRQINISYSQGRISSVSDATRSWTYGYDASGSLTTVTQPDAAQWTFALTGLAWTGHPTPAENCGEPDAYPSALFKGTMTHPSSAAGSFATQFVGHRRAGVRPVCDPSDGDPATTELSDLPRTWYTQAIVSKVITGPGVPAKTWTYNWNSAGASYGVGAETKVLVVQDSRGYSTRYTHGIRLRANEGQLLRAEEGWDAGTAVRTTLYTYQPPSGMPYPEPIGNSGLYGIYPLGVDPLSLVHRPLSRREIVQQARSFVWQAGGFDAFARPTSVTRASSLGSSRTEATAYFDQLGKWVLGQVASVTESGTALVMERHSYDPETARRTGSARFGRQVSRYAYNADGTLAGSYDAADRGTIYANWKRGLPRGVTYPDGSTESAEINDLGQVTALTSAANTTTRYAYDAMGRLAQVTPPAGDAVAYKPTVQSFQPVAADEYGLPAGHWRETASTGNEQTVTYFDALWRPVLTVSADLGNVSGTSRMVQTRWDIDGRKTFESYPQRSISTVSQGVAGTAWTYDALGRQTQQTQDSELGVLSTTTEYLGGFERRKTNARGLVSTEGFQTFDEPREDALAQVWAPEGVQLSISRDVFGKPLAITRSGSWSGGTASAARSYLYDGYQRLCKTVEPESGATVQAYDAAGNVAWRASGQSLPGGNCDQGSVPEGSKISYSYDALDRLTGTRYGDGSPGITRSYTADGLPQQVASAGATWTYQYNNRRLKTQESLAYGGSNYTFDWGIDAYGHVASLSYPGGPVVQYSPDALGRATQASGYASGVSYHPNGAIAGYTLANGVAHSQTQNLRGLPQQWRDAGVVQDLYSYDANANVTAITDQQEGVSSRSMGYDGLDRLTSANGVWGAAGYGYDPLDNLRSSTVGGRSLSHQVDAATNRLTSLSGSQNIGFGYDANGNITARGGQAYSFDIGNRLATAVGKADYSYDGWGRRVRVGYADGQVKVQVYGQDGQLLMSNHSSQGLTRHIYLGRRLIAESNSLTGTSYSHTDALGSPVARTNTSGQVLSRTRYEPYGATAAGTNPNGIGFTGHVNDPDTGLVQMQQRYYDPIAGRFLSVDPVTTDAATGKGFGRYHYANNNPYLYKDPNGQYGVAAFGVVAIPVLMIGYAVCDTCRKWIVNQVSGQSSSGSDGNGNKSDSAGGDGHRPVAGSSRADAENRITGGATPDRVSGSNRQYDSPPTGESADDIMKDIKELPGAKTSETSGSHGQVTVVTLPDGSRVIDRNSSTGPRTIQTQNPSGKSRTETRFPNDELRKRDDK